MALAGGARNWTPLGAPARPAAGGPRGGEPPAAGRPTDAPSLWVPDCARGVPRPARGGGHGSGSGGGWQQPAASRSAGLPPSSPPRARGGQQEGVGAGAPSSRVLHFSEDRRGGHDGSPRPKTAHSATERVIKRGGGGGGGGGLYGSMRAVGGGRVREWASRQQRRQAAPPARHTPIYDQRRGAIKSRPTRCPPRAHKNNVPSRSGSKAATGALAAAG